MGCAAACYYKAPDYTCQKLYNLSTGRLCALHMYKSMHASQLEYMYTVNHIIYIYIYTHRELHNEH